MLGVAAEDVAGAVDPNNDGPVEAAAAAPPKIVEVVPVVVTVEVAAVALAKTDDAPLVPMPLNALEEPVEAVVFEVVAVALLVALTGLAVDAVTDSEPNKDVVPPPTLDVLPPKENVEVVVGAETGAFVEAVVTVELGVTLVSEDVAGFANIFVEVVEPEPNAGVDEVPVAEAKNDVAPSPAPFPVAKAKGDAAGADEVDVAKPEKKFAGGWDVSLDSLVSGLQIFKDPNRESAELFVADGVDVVVVADFTVAAELGIPEEVTVTFGGAELVTVGLDVLTRPTPSEEVEFVSRVFVDSMGFVVPGAGVAAIVEDVTVDGA